MSVTEHPSYGALEINRVISNREQTFFGEEGHHRAEYLSITISKAGLVKPLCGNKQYPMSRNIILRFKMPIPSLFRAILGGRDVPITLSFVSGEGIIEECPYTPLSKTIEDSVNEKLASMKEKIEEQSFEAKEVLSKKSHLTKKDKQVILKTLEKLESRFQGDFFVASREILEGLNSTVACAGFSDSGEDD